MKLPFLESYLEEYSSNDEEIKQLLEENNCKNICYRDVNNETNLDEYDYIIVIGKNELKRIVKNDKQLYEKYKSKLFFLGNYTRKYGKYDSYKNILGEIQSGININVTVVYKKAINLSNLTKYVSLSVSEHEKYCENWIVNENINSLYYLPSSVNHLSIYYSDEPIPLTNLPNKLKIVYLKHILMCDFKKAKLPRNAIIIKKKIFFKLKKNLWNKNSEYLFHKKLYKDEFKKIKTNKYIIITNRINNNSDENDDCVTLPHNIDKIIIIKNDTNIKLLHKFVPYSFNYKVCSYKFTNILMCKTIRNIKNAWKIISEDFCENCLTGNYTSITLQVIKNKKIKNIDTGIEEEDVDIFLDKACKYVVSLAYS